MRAVLRQGSSRTHLSRADSSFLRWIGPLLEGWTSEGLRASLFTFNVRLGPARESALKILWDNVAL
jgi:hypothetical protein